MSKQELFLAITTSGTTHFQLENALNILPGRNKAFYHRIKGIVNATKRYKTRIIITETFHREQIYVLAARAKFESLIKSSKKLKYISIYRNIVLSGTYKHIGGKGKLLFIYKRARSKVPNINKKTRDFFGVLYRKSCTWSLAD